MIKTVTCKEMAKQVAVFSVEMSKTPAAAALPDHPRALAGAKWYQPPLPATVAMLADMLTGLAEPPPGQADIAAGKAAFTALCRQLDDAIAR